MQLIDGRQIAEKVKDQIAEEVFGLVNGTHRRPSLGIILVGNRPDSRLYVSLKEKEAKLLGIDTHRYEFEENASEQEIIDTVKFLNKDEEIDSILIQLPLPEHINSERVMKELAPLKDADGFHPEHPVYVQSPVISAVGAMLDHIQIKPQELKAYALFNSEVFGRSLVSFLQDYGFKESVGIASVNLKDSLEDIKKADVLISAIGVPLFVSGNMLKQDAAIIDIGTNRLGDKVVGDVDFESVKDKVSYISPVPGGVGPLTIAYLFKNVLEIYKHKSLS